MPGTWGPDAPAEWLLLVPLTDFELIGAGILFEIGVMPALDPKRTLDKSI